MTEKDQIITIDTLESIGTQFRLAGIGTRFIAYLIDKLIQMGLVLGLGTIALLLLILTGKFTALPQLFIQVQDWLGWWLIAPVVLAYEIFTKGYFIVFEYFWNGSTPGKRSQEIRVIRKAGQSVSFLAVIIRNLLRMVDILAEIYPIGLIVMFIDYHNRRLGDLAAGTLVVREAKLTPLEICSPSEAQAMVGDEIFHIALEMTAEDYDLVKKFLARRDALDPDHRQELAKQILGRVSRGSVSAGEHASDPEALLEKLEALCRRTR